MTPVSARDPDPEGQADAHRDPRTRPAGGPVRAGGRGHGLIRKRSPQGVGETLDRLETIPEGKGITVALRWPHGARAAGVDIKLRETELMIFGNPGIGSHLMTRAQTAGIDLPLKALAWRDADGQVWPACKDPAYIAERHGIDGRGEGVAKMSAALDQLTGAAVAAD